MNSFVSDASFNGGGGDRLRSRRWIELDDDDDELGSCFSRRPMDSCDDRAVAVGGGGGGGGGGVER